MNGRWYSCDVTTEQTSTEYRVGVFFKPDYDVCNHAPFFGRYKCNDFMAGKLHSLYGSFNGKPTADGKGALAPQMISYARTINNKFIGQSVVVATNFRVRNRTRQLTTKIDLMLFATSFPANLIYFLVFSTSSHFHSCVHSSLLILITFHYQK